MQTDEMYPEPRACPGLFFGAQAYASRVSRSASGNVPGFSFAPTVIARPQRVRAKRGPMAGSGPKQSSACGHPGHGLLRRCAPRNDGSIENSIVIINGRAEGGRSVGDSGRSSLKIPLLLSMEQCRALADGCRSPSRSIDNSIVIMNSRRVPNPWIASPSASLRARNDGWGSASRHCEAAGRSNPASAPGPVSSIYRPMYAGALSPEGHGTGSRESAPGPCRRARSCWRHAA
jgi:hypothetical protein